MLNRVEFNGAEAPVPLAFGQIRMFKSATGRKVPVMVVRSNNKDPEKLRLLNLYTGILMSYTPEAVLDKLDEPMAGPVTITPSWAG